MDRHVTHRKRTRGARAVLGSVMLLWCSVAGAQTETSSTAETLFREGREAVKRGDYAVACPKFEESQRLEPANGTLLNLALCEEGWGHLAEARSHLQEVLRAPDLDDQRRAIATEHAAALEPNPSSAEAPASPPLAPVDDPPAPASPVAAAPALPSTEPVPRDSERTASSSPHAAVYVLGGLGLLGLATCAVTGILVIDRADTVNTHCPNKLCDDEGLAAASSGRTLSAVSTATFGVGVALTALSAYFLLQPSKAAPRSAVRVGGLPSGANVSWVREF
jgi:hypothetical protein